jgi:hypothetical protein
MIIRLTEPGVAAVIARQDGKEVPSGSPSLLDRSYGCESDGDPRKNPMVPKSFPPQTIRIRSEFVSKDKIAVNGRTQLLNA